MLPQFGFGTATRGLDKVCNLLKVGTEPIHCRQAEATPRQTGRNSGRGGRGVGGGGWWEYYQSHGASEGWEVGEYRQRTALLLLPLLNCVSCQKPPHKLLKQ